MCIRDRLNLGASNEGWSTALTPPPVTKSVILKWARNVSRQIDLNCTETKHAANGERLLTISLNVIGLIFNLLNSLTQTVCLYYIHPPLFCT